MTANGFIVAALNLTPDLVHNYNKRLMPIYKKETVLCCVCRIQVTQI